jgi:predicted small metal-binding protein
MAKFIECDNLFPGCPFEVLADSETELLEKVAEHAAASHGVTEITTDLLAKVKGFIRDA